MGERKVLNKYIPADFDPQLVPRGKKPKDDLVPVRMMLPFSIQCSTCSSFLYRGRKFNSKKEPVKGIDGKYLGIQRFRFYIKCSDCSRPITFLTDPKNADYEMESGGTRNYEVWHDENKTNAEFEKQTEEDEKMDSMKALENRVAESQREMAELDALEEIRAMNQRHVSLMKGGRKMDAAEAVLKAREAAVGVPDDEEELNENGLTKDEEDLVKSIKFGASNNNFGEGDDDGASSNIRRLGEEDELLAEKQRREDAEALILKQQQIVAAKGGEKKNNLPLFKVKRKKKKKDAAATAATAPEPKRVKTVPAKESIEKLQKDKDSDSDSNGGGGGALGGLLCYGSDSS
eukprot:CAMPEP_0183715384 /NCGR_PEP_ID=MMETSP0737-20130205/9627_1 /TAXON_ID=385413 /ORGANISM="Thalassiosira miniscula, Strain CCMP1093" /LENGTH=345 /DNA_ID=CAMNT_0025944475 /DNA_START=38 /DNA_END=1075 /DNA_ORIENTATION=-